MSLKLIWAGPWNERSAIGRVGLEVVQELIALGHSVELIRTEVGPDLLLPARSAPVPMHVPGERSIAELMQYADGVIVNLGDHYGFHGGALPILQQTTPLVILHDAWMGHFINAWRAMAGADAWRVDNALEATESDESGIALLCGLASGAVIHSDHYRAAVEAACPGPVATIPLSLGSNTFSAPRPIGDRLVVATLGHVNANKRAEEVIRAIGSSPRLKGAVLYMLVGPIEPAQKAHLQRVARAVGALEPHFTGWVPEDVLQMVIAGTDVFCCLRYPALEGGSASLVFSLLSGRPTLVSNHACYAEVPDGLVMKCVPGQEAADVVRHLEAVLDAPEAAQAMGRRARDHALHAYSPATYATQLLTALEAATKARPGIRAAQSIGRRLAEFGTRPDDPAVERMGAALAELLGNTR